MQLEPASKKEIKHIAAGIAICDVVAFAICAVLKVLSLKVCLLALACSLITLGGFVWLCVSVQKSLEKGTQAKSYLTKTYVGRMLLYAVTAVVIVNIGTNYAEMIVGVLPLFYPGLTIKVMNLLFKEKE